MLDNLTQRLTRVVNTLRGQARLTEENIADALREVRLALLEADVALPVVKDFIARVREKAIGQEVVGSLTPGQALVGVVHRELTELMGGAHAGLNLATTPPAVILTAGLHRAVAPGGRAGGHRFLCGARGPEARGDCPGCPRSCAQALLRRAAGRYRRPLGHR